MLYTLICGLNGFLIGVVYTHYFAKYRILFGHNILSNIFIMILPVGTMLIGAILGAGFGLARIASGSYP